MTHPNTNDMDTLVAEIARLRLALSHLAMYGRAVLDCRDNGGIAIAHQGFPAYQAHHALTSLDECVARVLAGDWQPLSPAQVDQVWQRHCTPGILRGDHLTRSGFGAALNDLLWHPPHLMHTAPDLPITGTAGLATE